MSALSFDHLDALNMMRAYNGLHRIDLFVMSIPKSIIDDLTEEGYARSGIFKWDITRKGRQTLFDAGILSFGDTRR